MEKDTIVLVTHKKGDCTEGSFICYECFAELDEDNNDNYCWSCGAHLTVGVYKRKELEELEGL